MITGSASIIGLGLAEAFLARDCAVTVSGHSKFNLDKAYRDLAANFRIAPILDNEQLVFVCGRLPGKGNKAAPL